MKSWLQQTVMNVQNLSLTLDENTTEPLPHRLSISIQCFRQLHILPASGPAGPCIQVPDNISGHPENHMRLHRDLTISYGCPQLSLISELAGTYILHGRKDLPLLYCMCFGSSCLFPARNSRDSSRRSHYIFL